MSNDAFLVASVSVVVFVLIAVWLVLLTRALASSHRDLAEATADKLVLNDAGERIRNGFRPGVFS